MTYHDLIQLTQVSPKTHFYSLVSSGRGSVENRKILILPVNILMHVVGSACLAGLNQV